MSHILREAEEQLEALLREHSDDSRQTILQLFLLAFEREELVSIGYRDSLISARLKKMPLDDDVRELIRRALIWAWKDEEMHALFSRGAILELGSARLRCQALACQAAGAIGGWAASALQQTFVRCSDCGRSEIRQMENSWDPRQRLRRCKRRFQRIAGNQSSLVQELPFCLRGSCPGDRK